jgi:hypothetical protein
MLPELSDGEAGVLGAALCEEDGGLEEGSVLVDPVFFEQAVNMSATASALRATLVFIDWYPNGVREPSGRKRSERVV